MPIKILRENEMQLQMLRTRSEKHARVLKRLTRMSKLQRRKPTTLKKQKKIERMLKSGRRLLASAGSLLGDVTAITEGCPDPQCTPLRVRLCLQQVATTCLADLVPVHEVHETRVVTDLLPADMRLVELDTEEDDRCLRLIEEDPPLRLDIEEYSPLLPLLLSTLAQAVLSAIDRCGAKVAMVTSMMRGTLELAFAGIRTMVGIGVVFTGCGTNGRVNVSGDTKTSGMVQVMTGCC